jgi:hypothetical protein
LSPHGRRKTTIPPNKWYSGSVWIALNISRAQNSTIKHLINWFHTLLLCTFSSVLNNPRGREIIVNSNEPEEAYSIADAGPQRTQVASGLKPNPKSFNIDTCSSLVQSKSWCGWPLTPLRFREGAFSSLVMLVSGYWMLLSFLYRHLILVYGHPRVAKCEQDSNPEHYETEYDEHGDFLAYKANLIAKGFPKSMGLTTRRHL